MRRDESATGSTNSLPSRVIPPPIALYELDGLIYEVYRGARPPQSFVIRWERLKSFAITRDDHSTADVHISQGGRRLITD